MTPQNRDNTGQNLTLYLTIAYRAVRRAPMQFSLSVLALTIFAFMSSFFIAASHTAARLSEKLAGADHLTVYVPSGLEQKRIDELVGWAQSRGSVRKVEQKPSDFYFSELCDSLGLDADALGKVPPDVAPRVLIIALDPNESSDGIARFMAELRARSEVLDVHFAGDTLLSLSELLHSFVRLVFSLLLVCCLLIAARLYSGGKSVVRANEDAIAIMRLAGAKPTTIAGPFACYGLLQWGLSMALTFVLWNVLFPIGAIRLEGVIAELEGLLAPELNLLDVVLIALTAAALSLAPLLLVHRSKLRTMDVFSCQTNG